MFKIDDQLSTSFLHTTHESFAANYRNFGNVAPEHLVETVSGRINRVWHGFQFFLHLSSCCYKDEASHFHPLTL